MTAPVPPSLHLSVRESGGGTEQNIRRLCAAEPAFSHLSLEALMGWPLDWRRWWPSAFLRLRRCRPRVVFCYGATAHLAAVGAWSPRGPALVMNARGERDFAGAKALIPLLLGWRFPGAAANARMLLPRRRGWVVYNGAPEPPPDEVPLLPGLPRPVFGVLARGAPEKGHDAMLGIWRGLGRPGTLVFAGDLGPDLRARAEAEGVLCPGFVEPGPLLRSLDLLCVPSDWEGIPTVIPEAMMRGVPVLATPVGGIPEVLRHGRNGYLLAREQWPDFLGGIDWDRARRVGARGRDFAQRHLSFDAMVEGFRNIARRLG